MLSLPWLGHLAHKHGPRKLLTWGSLGILFVASCLLLWVGYRAFERMKNGFVEEIA